MSSKVPHIYTLGITITFHKSKLNFPRQYAIASACKKNYMKIALNFDGNVNSVRQLSSLHKKMKKKKNSPNRLLNCHDNFSISTQTWTTIHKRRNLLFRSNESIKVGVDLVCMVTFWCAMHWSDFRQISCKKKQKSEI